MHRTFTLSRSAIKTSQIRPSTHNASRFSVLQSSNLSTRTIGNYGSRLFSTDPKSSLRFTFQSCMIPHPEKEDKGGEDAFFVSNDGRTLGVADGVGGWADEGVDPSIYARSIMKYAKEAYEANTKLEPVQVLLNAWTKCKSIVGSSTACVVVLDSDSKKIKTANLGDSGFIIIRDGKVLYHSPQQQFQFNFPYQLGSNNLVTPTHAAIKEFEAKVGDIVILATDGVYDNLFDRDILAIAKDKKPDMAKQIAMLAHRKGFEPNYMSPFALGCGQLGGKLDDVTVVTGIVTDENK